MSKSRYRGKCYNLHGKIHGGKSVRWSVCTFKDSVAIIPFMGGKPKEAFALPIEKGKLMRKPASTYLPDTLVRMIERRLK